MTRARLIYTDRAQVTASATGFNPDVPVAGHFKMRLRSGAVFVGVKLWFGQPLDPITFEPLDRSLRWCAAVNDRPVEIDRVWPRCADNPIDASEYRYLTSLQGWAEQHAPSSPFADPHRKVDLLAATTPLPF